LALEPPCSDGKNIEALEQALQTMKLPGMNSVAGFLSGVFCRLRRPDVAEDILKQLAAGEKAGDFVDPLEFAMVHFALGDKIKGMARMKEAVHQHSFNISYFVFDHSFDLVREDPDFAALMNEVHLPPASWREVPRYRR
jgi:hypothetical protein